MEARRAGTHLCHDGVVVVCVLKLGESVLDRELKLGCLGCAHDDGDVAGRHACELSVVCL